MNKKLVGRLKKAAGVSAGLGIVATVVGSPVPTPFSPLRTAFILGCFGGALGFAAAAKAAQYVTKTRENVRNSFRPGRS